MRLECEACEGTGVTGQDETPCKSCGGDGHHEIVGCPLKGITPDIWEMLRLSDWAEHSKYLPVAGGVLDQTDSFVESHRFIQNEITRIDRARKHK